MVPALMRQGLSNGECSCCVTDDGDGCSFVTDQMIADQMAQLNAAYGPFNFAFNFVSRDDTKHTAW